MFFSKHNFLIAFAILFFASCLHKPKQIAENYHLLIQKTIEKDANYLSAFKKRRERNWGDNWKLVNARIDDYLVAEISHGKNGDTALVSDTNCIFEWNQQNGSEGIIRRETYNPTLGAPDIQFLLYKNDSIYARGSMHFANAGEWVFMKQIDYLQGRLSCKPCGEFSYDNYTDSTIMGGHFKHGYPFSEEFQLLDSLGNVQCSYSSPKSMPYHYGPSTRGFKVILYTDTIVNENGHCDFVEVKQQ